MIGFRLLSLAALYCALGVACSQPSASAEPDGEAQGVAAKPVQLLDRIVAIVNDDAITEQELDERVNAVGQQLTRQGTPLPNRELLARQVLERLILERLQTQYAKESGLRIDDAQVDKALARIAQENKMQLTQFRDALAKDGVSLAKFRDDIRHEMTIARLREREIDSRITVSEGEVDAELQAAAARPVGEDEYLASHILLRLAEQATPEQIQSQMARANEALAALQKGTDFGQVSATYSDAQEALQGGNLGWRPAEKLPTLFAEALAKMSKGEVSPVLKSANGFHIVKLIDKRGKNALQNVNQTRVRHILLKVTDSVGEADARARIEQLKQRLDGGADFAELAKAASDDPSASKGGELGWIYPGDTVPEFERALDALQPDQISAPVQTHLGFHIIQVLERKPAEMSPERNRAAARLGVRQRKSDEVYQDWLRQLRDQAYVEYRLDEG